VKQSSPIIPQLRRSQHVSNSGKVFGTHRDMSQRHGTKARLHINSLPGMLQTSASDLDTEVADEAMMRTGIDLAAGVPLILSK
jgi:hypothetical protein